MVSRRQALGRGITDGQVEANIAAKRWVRVFPGVFATFSGPLPREAQLWAVLLRAGPGAMLSHDTAAELVGLLERPSPTIHVTVSYHRTPTPVPGVRFHRATRADLIRHPVRTPPQTRTEETVIDLTQCSRTLDDAIGWLARAVGARVTTASRLESALHARPRVRWRKALTGALHDVAEGCHSVLELAYLRDVERAHGLPRGERQAIRSRPGGPWYDDVFYRDYGVRVELDGLIAHPPHARARDQWNDNSAVLAGHHPLRYRFAAVHDHPCDLAAEIATLLQTTGWPNSPHPCRHPACTINQS
ncbi:MULTISPECIES: hypothetical protein [unclassified Pseudofrankia]|uniref:hypothetical protein n=1 Tax=unclassified Pseudofrankia TaxID=2994372 RepID=UPI0008DA42A0|nr:MULTISPECIES: hypothetical protein [unclassified Pseudofrankia]MDT3446382.1 hypothetical protein [Pseudofrankia sp. BMG5.37]OHV59314.1 hypothetical protein BCD48_41480 [Pseudofrankia sp. BMG5.36]